MAVFAVIQTRFEPALEERIKSQAHLKVRDGVWLVATDGTAEDVSELLGIASGHAGSAIILKPSSYHGRTSPNTWDWMQAHWE